MSNEQMNSKNQEIARLKSQVAKLEQALANLHQAYDELEQKFEGRTAELEETTNFLDSIVENIPNMIFVKEAETLRFVRLNKAGEQLIGIAREKMFGKNDYDFFPKEEADFFIAKDREILAEGELLDIPEEPIHTADKGVRLLHTKKVPILDTDGRRKYLLGISEDITERKQTEQSLRKRAVELETVAQVSTSASTILDPQVLMQTVVDLTKTSFDLYHVHIYLFDQTQRTLILVAGSGEIGQKMVAEGRYISLKQEQSLVAQAARNREPIVVNDVQIEPGFLPHKLLPETRAEMAVPMVVGHRILGVFDVQAREIDRFSDEDMRIQTTLAAQVAAALDNADLFQQTEQALNEMEILYLISTQLNVATDLDQVLEVMTLPETAPKLGSAALLLFHNDLQGWPEYAELVAASVYDETSNDVLSLPIGARFALTESPLTKLWLSSPDEPLLISRIADDNRVDPVSRSLCQQANAHAIAVIPLTLGDHQMGVASMVWIEEHEFSERDRRLYRSVASQAAVVVNNWLLLRQAETRAAQLEKLSQIEAALSQAVTEEEILTALAPTIEYQDSPGYGVSLGYINEDEQGQPVAITIVSSWRDGAMWMDDPTLGLVYQLENFPFFRFFVNTPDCVVLLSDVDMDERVDTSTRKMARQLGVRAAAILPLRSGGLWQGLVTFSWDCPYQFSMGEQLVFQQLLEPVAAVVASRRAYLAQQATLTEIELLYNTVRRLNEASNLQEVVATLAAGFSSAAINRVVLAVFEEDEAGNVKEMTVSANWHSGYGSSPLPVGTQYPRQLLATIQPHANFEPVFFSDIQRDERIDSTALAVLIELNVLAMAILPLRLGTRQLGVLLLEADDVHHFTDPEVRFLTSLAPHMAVTIDNQRLLAETQIALAEVEATQRRYTLQAWEAYQAKNSVRNYERVRQGETSLGGNLPAMVSQVVENNRALVTQPVHHSSIWDESNPDNDQLSPESCQSLIVPLTVRGEVIGVLGLQETDGDREWLPEEVALVEMIAKEIAQAAENLRLLDETQQRVAREKKVNEISDKIQAAQSLEEALQLAIKEVGMSLQLPRTTVQLNVEQRG